MPLQNVNLGGLKNSSPPNAIGDTAVFDARKSDPVSRWSLITLTLIPE
jgi:hypothetical protein